MITEKSYFTVPNVRHQPRKAHHLRELQALVDLDRHLASLSRARSRREKARKWAFQRTVVTSAVYCTFRGVRRPPGLARFQLRGQLILLSLPQVG